MNKSLFQYAKLIFALAGLGMLVVGSVLLLPYEGIYLLMAILALLAYLLMVYQHKLTQEEQFWYVYGMVFLYGVTMLIASAVFIL